MPAVRVLADLTAVSAAPPDAAGALWRLSGPRQLDANVVRLPAGAVVPEHREDAVDVLFLVLDGDLTITSDATVAAARGTLVWLPAGSVRALAAGLHGATYLTVHRRRPALTIGHRADR